MVPFDKISVALPEPSIISKGPDMVWIFYLAQCQAGEVKFGIEDHMCRCTVKQTNIFFLNHSHFCT